MHTVKCLMKSHRLLKKTAHSKTSHYFVLPIERAHQTDIAVEVEIQVEIFLPPG